MRNQSEFYDRETLYEQVWSEPVYKVAQRYGISNVAIAKVCRKLHIPVPGVGYWNKVASGQKLDKEPLPVYEDCPKVRRVYSSPEVLESKEVEHLVPEAFALEEQLVQQEALPERKIVCNPNVKLTNQYVLNTALKLKESKKRLKTYYGYGRCNSSDDNAFDVSVGPDNISRALAILQTLCDEFEKRNYSISPKPKDPGKENYTYGNPRREANPIYVKVLDVYISFRITETSKRYVIKDSKSSYDRYSYEPTGRLGFEIITKPYRNHARNTWHDGKNIRIEDQLNDIIINMIRVATSKKESDAWFAVKREEQRLEDEKRREKQRLQQVNKSRIEKLVHETERMVKLNQVRVYVETISAEGKRRLGHDYQGSDFSKWVEWANSFLVENDVSAWELPRFELSEFG